MIKRLISSVDFIRCLREPAEVVGTVFRETATADGAIPLAIVAPEGAYSHSDRSYPFLLPPPSAEVSLIIIIILEVVNCHRSEFLMS